MFKITEAYLVDGGRFTFETMAAAKAARRIFVPLAKIQTVLAVRTPMGLVLTNPLVILEEDNGTTRTNSGT